MPYYTKRLRACIFSALRNAPCTFEEIVRGCAGAYPTVVKRVLDSLNVHNSLVPLYTTQDSIVPYSSDAPVDFQGFNLVTYKISNNPVLSNWYFSWHTCKKIGQLDNWHGKKILFLGTPRLFEYFVIENKAQSFTLIDYDKLVIDELEVKYGENDNICILRQDINFLENFTPQYDYVFFDPPWSYNSYVWWLTIATRFVTPTGKLVFPLFPYMVRPTASKEREQLFQICRKLSRNMFTIPEFVEYDIPSFERNELVNEGICLRANWKVADFVILQGIDCHLENLQGIKLNTEYLSWREFSWCGIRWFIKNAEREGNNITNENTPLISLIDDSLFLKSPSSREPKLKLVNVLSSEGHGFYTSNTQKFIDIMNDLESNTVVHNTEFKWEHYTIDDMSKKFIERLRGLHYG